MRYMPTFFGFHQCKCSAGMWWTGFLILHALGALCQQTGSEYLSNESGARSRGDLKFPDFGISFRDSKESHLKNKSTDSLATYLYLRNKDDIPEEVNCLKCLEPFLVHKRNSLDSCRCLPCVQKFSKDDIKVSQELMIYFLRLDCTKYRNHNLDKSGTAKRLGPTTGHLMIRAPKVKRIENGLRADRELLSDNVFLSMRDHRKYGGGTSGAISDGYNHPEYRDYLKFSRRQSGRKNSINNRRRKQNRHEEMKEKYDNSEEFLTSENFGTLKSQPENDCRSGYCRKSKESLEIDEQMGNPEGNHGDKSKDGKDRLKKIFGQLMKMVQETKKKNLDNAFETHDTLTNLTEGRRQNFEHVSKNWKFPEQRRNGLDIYMNKYSRPSYKLNPSFNNRKTKSPLNGEVRDQRKPRRHHLDRHVLGSRHEPNEPALDLYKLYSSGTPKRRELNPKIKKESEVKYKKIEQRYEPPTEGKNLITLSTENGNKFNFERNDKNPLDTIPEDAEIADSSTSNIAADILDASLRNIKMEDDEKIEMTTVKGKMEPKRNLKELAQSNDSYVEEPTTTEVGVIQMTPKNEEYVTDPTTTTEMETWKLKKSVNELMEDNGTRFKNDAFNANLTPTTENTDSRSDMDKPKEDDVDYEDESYSESSTTINFPITQPKTSKSNKASLEVSDVKFQYEKSSEDEDEEVAAISTPSGGKGVEMEIATEIQNDYGIIQSDDSLPRRSLADERRENVTVEKLEMEKDKKEKVMKRSTRNSVSITEPTGHATRKHRESQSEHSGEEEEKRERKNPDDRKISHEDGATHGNVVKHRKPESKRRNSKKSHKRFNTEHGKRTKSRASEDGKNLKTGNKSSAEKSKEDEENNAFSTIIHVKGNHKTPNQSIQINVKLYGENDVDQLLHLLSPILGNAEETKNGGSKDSPNQKYGEGSDEEGYSDEAVFDDDVSYMDSDESDYVSGTLRDRKLGGYGEVTEYDPHNRKRQSVAENHGNTARYVSERENLPKFSSDATSKNHNRSPALMKESEQPEVMQGYVAEMQRPVPFAFPGSGLDTSGEEHFTRRKYARRRNDSWPGYPQQDTSNGDHV